MAKNTPGYYSGVSYPGDTTTTKPPTLCRSITVAYAKAGDDFPEEDEEFKDKIFKDNVNVLPQSKLSRILDTGDDCLDLAKRFNLGEMQVESIEDARYGGVNPANRFIDTLVYSKEDTELGELANIFEELHMEKASQALQEIVDESKNEKKDKIGDLTPYDFSQFYGTLKGGSTFQTNWKDVAEQLEMSQLIPMIEATRSQGYNYSMTSALLNILTGQARTVGEFVNVMNEVNQEKMGSLNSAVIQLDKDLKSLIGFKKKKIEKEKEKQKRREETNKR